MDLLTNSTNGFSELFGREIGEFEGEGLETIEPWSLDRPTTTIRRPADNCKVVSLGRRRPTFLLAFRFGFPEQTLTGANPFDLDNSWAPSSSHRNKGSKLPWSSSGTNSLGQLFQIKASPKKRTILPRENGRKY